VRKMSDEIIMLLANPWVGFPLGYLIGTVIIYLIFKGLEKK